MMKPWTHCGLKKADIVQMTFSNAFWWNDFLYFDLNFTRVGWGGGGGGGGDGPIDNKSSLVQIMAWHQTGAKPLSEPMMTTSTDTSMSPGFIELNNWKIIFWWLIFGIQIFSLVTQQVFIPVDFNILLTQKPCPGSHLKWKAIFPVTLHPKWGAVTVVEVIQCFVESFLCNRVWLLCVDFFVRNLFFSVTEIFCPVIYCWVKHIYTSDLCHHWLGYWLGSCLAPSYQLNQWWF